MNTNIKTDRRLLERLSASGRFVTKEQLSRQRVSFIYGNLPSDSAITRQQVESVLAKNEGESEAA